MLRSRRVGAVQQLICDDSGSVGCPNKKEYLFEDATCINEGVRKGTTSARSDVFVACVAFAALTWYDGVDPAVWFFDNYYKTSVIYVQTEI